MKPEIRTRNLILLGLASYLLFLVAQAPASLLTHLLPTQSGVRLSGLQGTVWAGQASNVRIQQHQLTDVNWSFNGWRLFTGKLAADIEARFNNQPVSTQAAITLTGAVQLHNTQVMLDASTVGELAQIPIAQLGGRFQIALEYVELARGAPPVASGMILWKQASVTVAETVSLDDVDIQLRDAGDPPLLAVISNRGGDIRLDGKASVKPYGDYQLQLSMTPSAGSSDNVRNSLKMFARPQNDGSYLLTNNGNLKQLGLM